MKLPRVLFVILIAVIFYAPSALALDCIPISPEEEFERSDVVFSGRVVDVLKKGDVADSTTFLVLRSWKGGTKNTLTVSTSGKSYWFGTAFNIGDEYLVYASGDPLSVGICSRTKLLAYADDDLSVLGRGKVYSNGSFAKTSPDISWRSAVAAVGVLIVAAWVYKVHTSDKLGS